MYGLAETLASKVAKQEDYFGAVPAVAVLPFFLAGALFPIGAMPAALTAIAKVIALTHALALLRYGVADPNGSGLHDIWGMSNVTAEAWLSIGVVALFAAALVAIAIRSFTRSAVRWSGFSARRRAPSRCGARTRFAGGEARARSEW